MNNNVLEQFIREIVRDELNKRVTVTLKASDIEVPTIQDLIRSLVERLDVKTEIVTKCPY